MNSIHSKCSHSHLTARTQTHDDQEEDFLSQSSSAITPTVLELLALTEYLASFWSVLLRYGRGLSYELMLHLTVPDLRGPEMHSPAGVLDMSDNETPAGAFVDGYISMPEGDAPFLDSVDILHDPRNVKDLEAVVMTEPCATKFKECTFCLCCLTCLQFFEVLHLTMVDNKLIPGPLRYATLSAVSSARRGPGRPLRSMGFCENLMVISRWDPFAVASVRLRWLSQPFCKCGMRKMTCRWRLDQCLPNNASYALRDLCLPNNLNHHT